MDKAAWIGLGTMGVPMVKNLAAKGFPVVAYNRTTRSVDIGDARVAGNMKEAVEGADVVFVMVSDGPAVHNVLFGEDGAVPHMKPGALVVNMSTIGVDETKQFALEMANRGIEWMDAPVSGSQGPAREGTLVVLAGGSADAFDRVKPMFLAMGKAAHHLGPVGSGAAMKLLVNGMLAATVAATSECIAVAKKAGLGEEAFLHVLSGTGMWSPILAGKREYWLKDSYEPAFALKHMTKDLGLLSEYAVQLSAALPSMTAALTSYLGAQAGDLAEYDMSAVYKHLAKLVGAE